MSWLLSLGNVTPYMSCLQEFRTVPEPINEVAIRDSYDLYLRVCGLYPRDGVLVAAARARHKAALQAYMIGAA